MKVGLIRESFLEDVDFGTEIYSMGRIAPAW